MGASYFTKFEKYSDDPDYPDVNSSAKGKDGPMNIGYYSDISEGSKDFIKACTQSGIPYSADFNTNPTLGTRGVNRVSYSVFFECNVYILTLVSI